MRSLAYVAVTSTAAWFLRGPIFALLTAPALRGAQWAHIENFNFRIFDPIGGLMLMIYASIIVGAVAASPPTRHRPRPQLGVSPQVR